MPELGLYRRRSSMSFRETEELRRAKQKASWEKLKAAANRRYETGGVNV